MRFGTALLLVVGLSACSADLPFGSALLTCTSVAECPQGAACVAGYCAPAGSPCISGQGATAQQVTDGTECAVKGLAGVCNSGQCAICGDRITEPGETCDDGNANNSDACTQRCNPPACGDGFLQAGEQCDDGNTSDDDACLSTCVPNTCGDRFVDQGSETCDDDNANDNDGCSHCQVNKWSPSVVVGYGLHRVASGYSFYDIEYMTGDGGDIVNLYDAGTNVVWRIDQKADRMSPLTKTDRLGGPAVIPENTIATQSNLAVVGGMAVRDDGDLYLGATLGDVQPYTDDLQYVLAPVVLRIDSSGLFHNVAGTGVACSASDEDDCGNGLLASAVQLYQVTALAFDTNGDLLIGDYYTLWRLDFSTNIMTRVFGTGYACVKTDGCGEDGDALDATVTRIGGIVVDTNGAIIVSDSGNDGYVAEPYARLLRIDRSSHVVTRLPDTGLVFPKGLSRAGDGTIYVADRDAGRVFALSPDHDTLTPVAGTSVPCASTDVICGADGQPALSTTLNRPSAVLVNDDASVLVADSGVDRVRRLAAGTMTVGIGTNKSQYNGVGIAGTSMIASAFTLDNDQHLLFGFDNEIMRLNPTTATADYVGGAYFAVCSGGPCGDGGPASDAIFDNVIDMAVDATGNLYFIATDNNRLRKVDPSGNVSTFAGRDLACNHTTNCGVASTDPTQAIFQSLKKIEIIGDALYTLEFDDERAVIRKISFSTGQIAVVAGANALGKPNDAKPASQALFSCPFDMTAGPDNSVLIADTLNCAVRKITGDTTMSTIASDAACTFSTDCSGWDATDPTAYGSLIPTSVATDPQGNVVVYNHAAHLVVRYNGSTPTPIMGDGTDTGPIFGVTADRASFAPDSEAYSVGFPVDIVRSMQYDTAGNLYLFEYPDFAIVKLDTSGFVSPVVVQTDDLASGNTDKGKLVAARALGQTSSGVIITDDTQVRLINADMSLLETVMGNQDGANETFDDLARYHVPISTAWGIAVDPSSNRAFIGDITLNQIFTLGIAGDPLSWTFDAYSPSTNVGFHDGDLADALFDGIKGLAYDAAAHRLYVADSGNHLVRVIDDTSSVVSTIAGTPGVAQFAGDNGAAASARLNNPSAVALASDGSIYISDTNNNRVRRVTPAGIITTVLGDGRAVNLASPTSSTGSIASPRGLRFDTFGNLWVTAGRAVHVIVSNDAAPPDGTTASFLALNTSAKDDFPASIISCLTDVDVGNDSASMLVLDSCQGMVLKLNR